MYREETSYIGLRVENSFKVSIEQAAAAEDRSVSKWITRVLTKEIERLKARGK